jgi:nicotinic acid phosphoribosyltransferase
MAVYQHLYRYMQDGQIANIVLANGYFLVMPKAGKYHTPRGFPVVADLFFRNQYRFWQYYHFYTVFNKG